MFIVRSSEIREQFFVRQAGCCFAYIELAGNHIRNKAGTVFAEKGDLAFKAGDGGIEWARMFISVVDN